MECWACEKTVDAVIKFVLAGNGFNDHLQTQLCKECWKKLCSGEFSSVSLDEVFTPEKENENLG